MHFVYETHVSKAFIAGSTQNFSEKGPHFAGFRNFILTYVFKSHSVFEKQHSYCTEKSKGAITT